MKTKTKLGKQLKICKAIHQLAQEKGVTLNHFLTTGPILSLRRKGNTLHLALREGRWPDRTTRIRYSRFVNRVYSKFGGKLLQRREYGELKTLSINL